MKLLKSKERNSEKTILDGTKMIEMINKTCGWRYASVYCPLNMDKTASNETTLISEITKIMRKILSLL